MRGGRAIFLYFAICHFGGVSTARAEEPVEALVSQRDALFEAGRYEDAAVIGAQVLDIRRQTLGARHADVAQSMNDLAVLLTRAGRHAEARQLNEESLDIYRETLGPKHVDVGLALHNLALVVDRQGDYPAARLLFEESLVILREAAGPRHAHVAMTLNHFGGLLQAQGDFPAARPALEESLEIWRESVEPRQLEVADALNSLALLEYAEGNYPASRSQMEEAVEIRREVMGPKHPFVAQSLNNLASVVQTQGDYATAGSLLEESLDIRRENFGPRHPDVANSLHNLAWLQFAQGKYREAQAAYEESIGILREAEGQRHPNVAYGLTGLALVLQTEGNYVAARAHYQEGLDIFVEAVGRRHHHVASILENYAGLLQAQGDYATAGEMYRESLDIRREVLGPEHANIATGLNDLAGLLQLQGDVPAARLLFEESLSIWRKVFGPRHRNVAAALHNLAGVLDDQGEPLAARALYEESLDIRREVLGPRHPEVAGSLGSLAMLLGAQGDYAAARPLVEESLEIRREALGPRHPDVALSLSKLAAVLEALGDGAGAQRLRKEALDITEERLSFLDALSEREALAYLDKNRGPLDVWLATYDDPAHSEDAWTHALRWKGTLGARQRDARAFAALDSDTAIAWSALAEVRRDLARRAFSERAPHDREAHRAEVALLSTRAEDLERELLASSAVFRRKHAIHLATPPDLCAALPANTAMVDILRISVRDDASYLAYVMAEDCTVHAVNLGAAGPIDDAVAEWRLALARVPRVADFRIDDAGAPVTARVWMPLAPLLDDVSRVLVVPDGPLAALPFAALPLGDGRYLLEEFTVGYLDRANDLLLPETATEASGAFVLGGVDFDAAAEGAAATVRSALAPCVEPFSPLSGTVREAEAFATRWRRARRREPLQVLRGTEATETAVSQALQGKAVAHLATHGFFATSAGCHSVLEGTGGVGYDPMLLSGLAVAGANRPADPFAPDDGILTAREVASLDLSGTGLVVLSACETGIGEVRSGQGVLGLRRAFATSGAQSLVMTLWAVGDADAEQLMDGLYDRILGRKPLAAGEALREAQLDVLRQNREATGLARPGSWAAWIASGK